MHNSFKRNELLSNWPYGRIAYKYRCFRNHWHYDALQKREIYYSAFESNRTDDPEEGTDIFDLHEPSFEEVLSVLIELLSQKLPELPYIEIENRAYVIAFQSPIWLNPRKTYNDLRIMHEEHITQLGIFCSTNNPNSNFCWEKFADSYSGFVVGYNIESLIQNQNDNFQEVHYYMKDKPKISWKDVLRVAHGAENFQNKILIEILLKKYCTKSHTKFHQEEEWRWIKFNIQNETTRKVIIDEQHIEQVIIGKNMSSENMHLLYQLAEEGGIPRKKITIQK